MSGYQRPRAHSPPSVKLARLPGQLPGAEIVNSAFTLLEAADAQNLKRSLEPAFPSLLLQAPDGSTYRVSVDISDPDNPTLALVQVPPQAVSL